MNTVKKYRQGFSLIEIMVALIIVAIGILALGKFHSELFRSTSDASQRTEALNLAQEVAEDLRAYATLAPEPEDLVWQDASQAQMSYEFIVDNQGGMLFQGKTPNANGYYVLGDKQVKWDVTTPATAPNTKDLIVSVLYMNESGENTELSLTTTIAGYDPNRLALVDDSGNAIGGGYARNKQQTLLVGTAPDVIPVGIGEYDVDGDGVNDAISRQTSKPTPDVSKKGGSVKSTFDVVTYLTESVNADTGTADAFVLEKYTTINCQCDKASSQTVTYTPSRITWFQNEDALLGGLLAGRTGITKLKDYGVSFPGTGSSIYQAQDATCNVCCRDHNDVALNSASDQYPIQSDADLDDSADPVPSCTAGDRTGCYDPGRTADSQYASGNHLHFINTTDLNQDDPYIEACRVLEIGGQERVMQDWRLVKLDVIPDSYFDTQDNIDSYSTYVSEVIQAFIDGDTLPTLSIPVDFRTINTGDSINLSARAIYVDYMASLTQAIDGYEEVISSTTPLYKIPFYTINVTKLVGWEVKNTSSVAWTSPWSTSPDYTTTHDASANTCQNSAASSPCVEDEQIEDELLVDDPQYTRGVFYANNASASSTFTVGAILYNGNEGLIDRKPADAAAINYTNYTESTLTLQITAP